MIKFTTIIFSLANFLETLGSLMFVHCIFDFIVNLVIEIQKILVRLAVRPLNDFRYLEFFVVFTFYFVRRARKGSRLKNLGPETFVRRSPSYFPRSMAVEFAPRRQPLLGFALSAELFGIDCRAIAPTGLEIRFVAIHLAGELVLRDQIGGVNTVFGTLLHVELLPGVHAGDALIKAAEPNGYTVVVLCRLPARHLVNPANDAFTFGSLGGLVALCPPASSHLRLHW